MLGISIYLSNSEKFNKEWLVNAGKHGFSSVFTSLHIPEDNPYRYSELLYNLSSVAKYNNMDLIVDVSRESLKYLDVDLNNMDKLLGWGLTGLRLDYGFSTEEIVDLSKQLKISLNASTLTNKRLQELIKKGLYTENVEASHNFYPRPETGLSKEYLIQKNKLFKSYNIKVSAFVPGDGEKRHPLYQGLPTVELHRELSPIKSCLDLKRNCFVDSVYIGDFSLQTETLSMFNYVVDNIIPIHYHGEVTNELNDIYRYLNEVHFNRLDPAHKVVRIARSRKDLHDANHLLEPHNTVYRSKGSITLDNYKYGRYAGEIQISRYDLNADPKVNVIGQVINDDISLLDFVNEGQAFLLQKVT